MFKLQLPLCYSNNILYLWQSKKSGITYEIEDFMKLHKTNLINNLNFNKNEKVFS